MGCHRARKSGKVDFSVDYQTGFCESREHGPLGCQETKIEFMGIKSSGENLLTSCTSGVGYYWGVDTGLDGPLIQQATIIHVFQKIYDASSSSKVQTSFSNMGTDVPVLGIHNWEQIFKRTVSILTR